MGEEVNKEEPKQDENVVADKSEEKIDSPAPQPPPPAPAPAPFVVYIDLHCLGCAKKIEKSISKMKGIEEVVIDMVNNQVTLKGLVEPQAICNRIMKKTKRMVKVLSPLPEAEGEVIPQVVASLAAEATTVELDVNMHCQACADQLKKKILKMKGVQNVEIELKSSKVTVTGTMDPNNLVDYVYRRTKKQAKIVPQPETAPAEEKKEENDQPNPKEEKSDGQKSDEPPTAEQEKKAEDEKPEEIIKEGMEHYLITSLEEEQMKKMYYFYPPQQPLYIVERLPPAPQMFSDENPNACTIC